MLTEFGKIIRMYRLENGLILKDMADTLDVPSSYLSAMEMGRKVVSDEFVNRLLSSYGFTDEEEKRIVEAAKLSANSVRVNLENASMQKKGMALSFARKFDGLDEETVKKIMEYLK